MVYFSDLNSVIESIYLSENICDKIGSCNIFVNPDNITYLVRKVVIINKLDYPDKNIDSLLKNNCEIISRIKLNRDDVKFHPYIIYPNFSIIWNGDTVDLMSDVITNCNFDIENMKLYFPKIKVDTMRVDEEGNLTALGWALQQVGINIKKDTPFVDLDVIKTKKLRF